MVGETHVNSNDSSKYDCYSRLSRQDFFCVYIYLHLISLVLAFLGAKALVVGFQSDQTENIKYFAWKTIGQSSFYFCIADVAIFDIVARRFHDTNRRAWLLWLILVPGIDICAYFLLYVYCFLPGTQEENQFGPVPPSTGRTEIVDKWRIKAIYKLKINRRTSRLLYWANSKNLAAICLYAMCLLASVIEPFNPDFHADRIKDLTPLISSTHSVEKTSSKDPEPARLTAFEGIPEKLTTKVAPRMMNMLDAVSSEPNDEVINTRTKPRSGPEFLLMASLFVAFFSVGTRHRDTINRLHDVGKSGWWILLGIIPLANIISYSLILYFCTQKGTIGDNKFACNPGPFEAAMPWLEKPVFVRLYMAWRHRSRWRIVPNLFSPKKLKRFAAWRHSRRNLRTVLKQGAEKILIVLGTLAFGEIIFHIRSWITKLFN